MVKKVISISIESANAKESGRPYEYVSVSADGVELNRIFIKGTEKAFYQSLIGNYEQLV